MKATAVLKIAIERKTGASAGRLLRGVGRHATRVGSTALPAAAGLGAFELSRQAEDTTGLGFPTHVALGLTAAMGTGRHNQRRILGGMRGGYHAPTSQALTNALTEVQAGRVPKKLTFEVPDFTDPGKQISRTIDLPRDRAGAEAAINQAKADVGADVSRGRDAALSDIMLKNLAFGGGAVGLDLAQNATGAVDALKDTAQTARDTAQSVGPKLEQITSQGQQILGDVKDTTANLRGTLQDISQSTQSLGSGIESLGASQAKLTEFLTSPTAKKIAVGAGATAATLALGWLAFKFYDRYSQSRSEEKDREVYDRRLNEGPRVAGAA